MTRNHDTWNRDTAGWIHDRDGIRWSNIPLPTGVKAAIYRLTHSHQPWSYGMYGWDVVERCICGAARFGILPVLHPRVSGHETMPPEGLTWKITGGWVDSNSRFTGTTNLYLPYLRPLEAS